MELVGGGKHTVTSKFFWIVASNRNPYTGELFAIKLIDLTSSQGPWVARCGFRT